MDDDARITFWKQPATQWDLVKFFLPLVLACTFWCVRVEVNQAKNEARFEAINQTLQEQNSTLRDIKDTLKDFSVTKDERGQRLASIEAKVDLLLAKERANK